MNGGSREEGNLDQTSEMGGSGMAGMGRKEDLGFQPVEPIGESMRCPGVMRPCASE